MSDCLFCNIIKGQIESFKVFEDDDAVAFLDINPAAPGHTLIVPKVHAVNLFDIDEISLRRLASTLKHVAQKVRTATKKDLMIIQNNGKDAGQVVDHLHFHIIPRTQGDGIGLMRGRIEITKEEMSEMVEKIKSAK